jgi:hypothetical protein
MKRCWTKVGGPSRLALTRSHLRMRRRGIAIHVPLADGNADCLLNALMEFSNAPMAFPTLLILRCPAEPGLEGRPTFIQFVRLRRRQTGAWVLRSVLVFPFNRHPPRKRRIGLGSPPQTGEVANDLWSSSDQSEDKSRRMTRSGPRLVVLRGSPFRLAPQDEEVVFATRVAPADGNADCLLNALMEFLNALMEFPTLLILRCEGQKSADGRRPDRE